MSIQSLGGRRFVLAVLVLLAVSVLRWLEHLDNGSFTAVLIASVCTYIAGDSWQRHVEIKTTGRAVGEPPKE